MGPGIADSHKEVFGGGERKPLEQAGLPEDTGPRRGRLALDKEDKIFERVFYPLVSIFVNEEIEAEFGHRPVSFGTAQQLGIELSLYIDDFFDLRVLGPLPNKVIVPGSQGVSYFGFLGFVENLEFLLLAS